VADEDAKPDESDGADPGEGSTADDVGQRAQIGGLAAAKEAKADAEAKANLDPDPDPDADGETASGGDTASGEENDAEADGDTEADTDAARGVPVIELDNCGRTFPGPPPVDALKPTDLALYRGQYLSIVGPSGSGKSTLLHLLGLLDTPTKGVYRLDGIDTGALSDSQRTGLRGSRIGFVFQAFHLLPHRTVLENVVLSQIYNGSPRSKRVERARFELERVGLGHRIDFTPTTLSGGERQRVAIARALVSRPSLLLADEPTGNLDSSSSAAILDLFDELHESGLTLAVITHDIDVSERAQRRVRIVDGNVEAA